MKKKRPTKGSELAGNAWTFATIEAARRVYQIAVNMPSFISQSHDASLNTGFFAHQPVLVFLWGPTMASDLVAQVERLATLAGGTELAKELKAELLRQVRLRWRALRSKRPLGGTIHRHHPHGKLWTDLRIDPQ